MHQFRKYVVMLRTAQATKMFLALIQIKMFASLLLQFYDAAKTAKKRLLKLTEHWKYNSFM